MTVHGQAISPGEVCIRIDKVGDSPGFWSGILASTQWLDATVLASTSKAYRAGDQMTFGLDVVQDDKFANRQTPRLNPKLIFNGAMLTLQMKESCRFDGHIGWIYACVQEGCKKSCGSRLTTPVEVWTGGGDALTLRLRDELERTFKQTADLPLATKGTAVYKILIPTHVGWEQVGNKTKILYTIKVLRMNNAEVGSFKGTCWDSALGPCATQILNRARELLGASHKPKQ
jgi:hypothetical protein